MTTLNASKNYFGNQYLGSRKIMRTYKNLFQGKRGKSKGRQIKGGKKLNKSWFPY
jgi:hypothetical protein